MFNINYTTYTCPSCKDVTQFDAKVEDSVPQQEFWNELQEFGCECGYIPSK